ncbi:unnamed protein product [Calypogeia fissa]
MEVIAYFQAGETVAAVLGGVLRLIKEILRAREDVHSVPTDIDKLLKVVDELRPVIDKIQAKEAKVQDKEVLSNLQKLGEELAAALEKVDEYEKKEQKEKQRPEVEKFVKALFQQGATKQKKEIGAICMAIKREHEKLNKALTAGTYVITVDTYSTVLSTHSIAEGTQVIVQDTAGTVYGIKSSLETFLAKEDQRGSSVPSAIKEPSIVDDLESRAYECLDNESYSVYLGTAEGQTNDFYAPRPKYQNADADQSSESMRAAREGGLDVKNYTKVQFQIEVQNECYFYVFSFEKGLPTATNLELIFPKHTRCQNKLISNGIRKFPDQDRYKADPQTVKLEKSASVKDGVQGQVLLYVVLSGQPLAPGAQDGSNFDKGTIIDRLTINLKLEDTSEDIYVKRFLFDIS